MSLAFVHQDAVEGASPASQGSPRLLLVATMCWMFPARLALALRQAGFHVEAICQRGHPIRLLKTPIRTHKLGWLSASTSIKTAINNAAPDLIIACDDPSVQSLHQLHRSDRGGRIARMIENSLGIAAGFDVAENRSKLIGLARSLGLRVPKSSVVVDGEELAEAAARMGYPCVLKRDQTWSGMGVRVVHGHDQLAPAWSWIAGGISRLRATKATLRERRPSKLLDALAARSAALEVQEFVPGTPANRAVLCRDGRVIDGISVLALQTAYPGGPASVVRIIDHPEMTRAAETLVGWLGLSGLCGFDFVISPSGDAYLLELNPRATPISHLAVANRSSLPAALYHELTGGWPVETVCPVSTDVVALFPTEWERDPVAACTSAVHHDAPLDEPGLLAWAKFAPGSSLARRAFLH